MPRTLDEAATGEKVTITRIGKVDTSLRQRLLDMGVTRGTEIVVERVAPLGDPVEVMIKGYHLAIRKSEGKMIEITDG